jgi:hypothetical protein
MDADQSASIPDFETWVEACFTLTDDSEFWNRAQLPGQIIADYLARLFEQSALLATKHPRDRLAKGLWWICGCLSGFVHSAMDASVPDVARRRWLRAISHLYTELIDPLCESISFSEIDEDPLCTAAYMLWDMDSVEGATFVSSLHEDCLHVLQTAIDCKSAACIRSGLHGLGHWIGRAEFERDTELAERLRERIDKFLRQHPHLSPEMVEYARAARADRIL